MKRERQIKRRFPLSSASAQVIELEPVEIAPKRPVYVSPNDPALAALKRADAFLSQSSANTLLLIVGMLAAGFVLFGKGEAGREF